MNKTALKNKIKIMIDAAFSSIAKVTDFRRKLPYDIRVLKRRRKSNGVKDIYIKIGLAVGLVIIILPITLFTDYVSTSAYLVDRETRLVHYLAANDVPVGKVIEEDRYEQIFYTFEGEDVVITDSRTAKGDPVADEEYIAWMEEINGRWQIFLYHIPTENLMQLSRTGNNINPKISNGKVVWQGWDENAQNHDGSLGNWQVFVFDGKVIRQISQGGLAESADIEDNFVVFSQRYNEGWKVFAHSIQTNTLQELTPGFTDGGYVELRDGDVFYGRDVSSRRKHHEKVNQMFLLDFPFESEPGEPEEVNTDNMREYLEKLIEDAETLQENEALRNNRDEQSEQSIDVQGVNDEVQTTDTATQSGEINNTTNGSPTGSADLE